LRNFTIFHIKKYIIIKAESIMMRWRKFIARMGRVGGGDHLKKTLVKTLNRGMIEVKVVGE